MLKERGRTIYASDRRVSGAGDLHVGKAWKVVRRPSDMVRTALTPLHTLIMLSERALSRNQANSGARRVWEELWKDICQRYVDSQLCD